MLQKDDFPLVVISYLALFSTGLVLSLVRLRDSYYRGVLKNEIYELFGKNLGAVEEWDCVEIKPLNTYLVEHLKTKLIKIILTGLVEFSTESQKKIPEEDR